MGIGKLFGYGLRALKLAPEFLLGTGSEVIGKAARHTKGSIWTKVKAGGLALEKNVARQSAKNGGFFTRLFKNTVGLPKFLANGFKSGGIKGLAKAVGKRMPLIGSLITIACEAPNIYRAFRDGGFMAGMKEIGGAGVELGCMAGGAAIGSAICPGIGTAIGGVIGGIVGMFVRGKTYTDKQEEAKQIAQGNGQPVQYTDAQVAALKRYGAPDELITMLQQKGYPYEAVEQELLGTEQPVSTRVDNSSYRHPIPMKYTDAEITKLKSYRLDDAQIAQAQKNGFTVREIEETLKIANGKTSTTVTNPMANLQNLNLSSLNTPINQAYNTMMFGSQSLPNSYSNDMFYNRTFTNGTLNPYADSTYTFNNSNNIFTKQNQYKFAQ